MLLKHTLVGVIMKYLKTMKNNVHPSQSINFNNDINVIDYQKKISDLTVEEFLSINKIVEKKYEYGINGIAKIFGCSRDKAQKIKNSGDIDDAIFQNKNIIVIDVEKALMLFGKNGSK